jgi:hypothetical protein
VGDCDDNRHVTADELLKMTSAALGQADVSICAAGLPTDDARSTVDTILRAINDALTRCAS